MRKFCCLVLSISREKILISGRQQTKFRNPTDIQTAQVKQLREILDLSLKDSLQPSRLCTNLIEKNIS